MSFLGLYPKVNTKFEHFGIIVLRYAPDISVKMHLLAIWLCPLTFQNLKNVVRLEMPCRLSLVGYLVRLIVVFWISLLIDWTHPVTLHWSITPGPHGFVSFSLLALWCGLVVIITYSSRAVTGSSLLLNPCLESAANWLKTRMFDRFFQKKCVVFSTYNQQH